MQREQLQTVQSDCLTRRSWTNLHNYLKRTGDKSMSERDTYKYELRRGNKVVYVGTTKDLERRESEHKADGKDFTRMVQIGRKTTTEAAGEWESDRISTYKSNHNGQRPEYNLNDSGK